MRIIVLLMLGCTAHATTLVQMACGGPGGAGWATDTKQGGGAYWTSVNQPAMALQPIPYQTLCYSSGATPFSRTFTLPAGNYTVSLKWLEPNKTAAGQRIFNVSINGAPAAIGLDVFAASGGALKPYDRTFPVSASGGFIVITLAGQIGNALLSAIQIDTAAADTSAPITCESDTIKVGVELTSPTVSQEVTILTDVPGNWRWDQVTICPTQRFLGQTRVTASMGRPGTNNIEMTGVEVPLDNQNTSYCWTARPAPPTFTGPYEVAINFKAYSMDVEHKEIPGDISKLTGGEVTWEACGYPGRIGNLIGTAKVIETVPLLQCSGAYSHVDPLTGKNIIQDCAGLLWAQFNGLSIVGMSMPGAFAGPNMVWKRIR